MFEFRTKYNCIRFLADSDGGDLVIENKSKAHWMCLCMHELAESEWMRRGCRNKCVYINFSFAFFSFPYYRLPHLCLQGKRFFSHNDSYIISQFIIVVFSLFFLFVAIALDFSFFWFARVENCWLFPFSFIFSAAIGR